MSSELRASSTERAVRYRCTWLWSVPKYESIRKVPPMSPDQTVYGSLSEKEKSKVRSRPAAPATASASSRGTGSRAISTTAIAITAVTITTICFTSAQVTACTPPTTV